MVKRKKEMCESTSEGIEAYVLGSLVRKVSGRREKRRKN